MGKHNSEFLNYLRGTLVLHFFETMKPTSECGFPPLATLHEHRLNIDSFDSRCGYINGVECSGPE